MTKITVRGVSTTTTFGTEQCEQFFYRGKSFIQYDYRHTDGSLFSCVKQTLEECRKLRRAWIEKLNSDVN